jgi:hypothetical protein
MVIALVIQIRSIQKLEKAKARVLELMAQAEEGSSSSAYSSSGPWEQEWRQD